MLTCYAVGFPLRPSDSKSCGFVSQNLWLAGKWGSVFTVTIMMVGCILLTLTGIGLSGRQMAIWYIIAQVPFPPLIPWFQIGFQVNCFIIWHIVTLLLLTFPMHQLYFPLFYRPFRSSLCNNLHISNASHSIHAFLKVVTGMQFVFGYGVGGEYPMAAGSAAERAEAGGRKTASKRGREVSNSLCLYVIFHLLQYLVTYPSPELRMRCLLLT